MVLFIYIVGVFTCTKIAGTASTKGRRRRAVDSMEKINMYARQCFVLCRFSSVLPDVLGFALLSSTPFQFCCCCQCLCNSTIYMCVFVKRERELCVQFHHGQFKKKRRARNGRENKQMFEMKMRQRAAPKRCGHIIEVLQQFAVYRERQCPNKETQFITLTIERRFSFSF